MKSKTTEVAIINNKFQPLKCNLNCVTPTETSTIIQTFSVRFDFCISTWLRIDFQVRMNGNCSNHPKGLVTVLLDEELTMLSRLFLLFEINPSILWACPIIVSGKS
jgi:hypothetical protein